MSEKVGFSGLGEVGGWKAVEDAKIGEEERSETGNG